MSIPTQEANLMSSAIGELFLHRTTAGLPDNTWQANAAANPNSGSALQYNQLRKGPDSEQWIRATANEIARLAQGRQGGPTVTNTMFLIPHTAVPADRKATYLRIVAALKVNKTEKYRICFIAGGNLIDYEGNVSTPTVDMTTIKCL
jgi:hypothetical protein